MAWLLRRRFVLHPEARAASIMTITKLLDRLQRLSIRTRASLAAALLSTLVVVTLTAVVLQSLRDDFRAVLMSQQSSLVERAARELDAKLAQDVDILRVAAEKLADAHARGATDLRSLYSGDVGLLAHFDDLLVLDPNGQVLADVPPVPGRSTVNASDRAFFRQAMRTRKPVVSEPVLSKLRAEPIINIAAPALDADGRVVALLVGVLRLDSTNMLSDLVRAKIGQSGYFVLMTRSADPVYIVHPDRARVLQPRSRVGGSTATTGALAGDETSREDSNSSGIVALRSYRVLHTADWLLEAVFPSAEAFAPIGAAERRIVMIAAVVALLTGMLAWAAAHHLLGPLTRLRDRMQQMRGGLENEAPVSIERRDEIGDLAATFNSLMEEHRKARSAALADAQNLRLASKVFETTADAVIISDATDHIIMVNPAFSRMTGYAAHELVGLRLAESPFRPIDPDQSAQRMQQQLRDGFVTAEVLRFRKDGSELPLWVTASNVTDPNGVITHFVRVFTDISPLKASQRKLEQLARNDPLTGLLNRRGFDERLDEAMKQAHVSGAGVAVLFVDLDSFKAINDSLGHASGDELLRGVANRLCATVRATDALCRIGGDEFAAILCATSADSDAADAAQRMLEALDRPFTIAGETVQMCASIGYAQWPRDGFDAEEIIRAADAAMYRAKRVGGHCALRHLHVQLSVASA